MIYGGVVLKDNPFVITDGEMVSLSQYELDEKYDWLGGAPNIETAWDTTTGDMRVRAKVPVITDLNHDPGFGII